MIVTMMTDMINGVIGRTKCNINLKVTKQNHRSQNTRPRNERNDNVLDIPSRAIVFVSKTKLPIDYKRTYTRTLVYN